jgi:hypothetical protein
MAKNKTDYYLKLQKKFKKTGLSLAKFCDTRKPKLSYDTVRQAFLRLKKARKISDSEKSVTKKPIKKKAVAPANKEAIPKKMQRNPQSPTTARATKAGKKKVKKLSPRKQKLLDIELSNPGMTKGQMAEAAGFTAQNKSKAFIQASQTFDYQTALAKSKARLREQIGISREAILTRMLEIGFARIRDVTVLENGAWKLRDDVDFDKDGADLAIKGITIKTRDITNGDRTETHTEYKIELADNLKALNDAVKIGGYFDDGVFSSVIDGNKEMVELWRQFQQHEITANDLSMQLAMRGLIVPAAVQLQAKAELTAIARGGGDDDINLIDLMDSYDEMLEDAAIAKKKKEVEATRKRELEEREKELEELNASENEQEIEIYADQSEETDSE